MVYLDLTHKSKEFLETRLGGIIEIYRKFVGEDPVELPMKIFPGVHYSMGGLWTQYTAGPDYERVKSGDLALPPKSRWEPEEAAKCGLDPEAPNNMMTNLTGLYAFGEVNYQYHGGTRLGANALLSCIFDGLFCGRSVVNYVRERADAPATSVPAGVFDAGVEAEEQKLEQLLSSSGGENAYAIAKELGDEMTAAATVVKTGERTEQALRKLDELRERYGKLSVADSGMWTNQTLSWARAVGDMLALADPILRGGLLREESRGSHYRTDFLERDDDRFLKTTVAEFDASTGRSRITFEEVEAGIVTPRKRDYSSSKGKASAGGTSAGAAAAGVKEKEIAGAGAGPRTAEDPKGGPRVSDPTQEPDINGVDPTQEPEKAERLRAKGSA
jgi:succinate dehydrogenase / fumarate reductase flavoprotein subunit